VAKGEFKINFKALPDESVDKKSQPVFYYEVSADVTDINGETRSGNTSVAVAYQALQLSIDMPEKLNSDSLKAFSIRSANINDIFEKATVNVTFTRIKSPDKIFRSRYWEMPDQFVMSRDEYYGYFPYDVYKDEDRMQNWPLAEKFLDKTDSTNEKGNWELGTLPTGRQVGNWAAGWYKIVATAKDKYGEEVRAEKFIQLTSNNSNEKITEPLMVNVTKGEAQPGEKISYKIRSGFSS